jgi:hypothetical protein
MGGAKPAIDQSSVDSHDYVIKPPPTQMGGNADKEQKLEAVTKMHEHVKRQLVSQNPRLTYPKQKRTIRRTYKVGKSKTFPKVTVLLSNRTLRNHTMTKTHELKQTPIEEVRRYLMKKGMIKVGSTAPNDVLRKMYEAAQLICGEIQNHNPDNLLYNFLNT